MSLLMKWAELACFSQNPVLSGSLSMVIHIPPVRMVCRVQSCFFTQVLYRESHSAWEEQLLTTLWGLSFRELTHSSPLNLTLWTNTAASFQPFSISLMKKFLNVISEKSVVKNYVVSREFCLPLKNKKLKVNIYSLLIRSLDTNLLELFTVC